MAASLFSVVLIQRQVGLGAWRINSRLSERSPPTRTPEDATPLSIVSSQPWD
ncbi:hypothetical protein [Oscillatoria sp. FACHB-1407]|uniref:hypothetical protein n=1 Tax=Oscillatoria sp. FACHB-1407 TaxID=2692847 RepID=UPI001683D040|nr:hypothetical protein [Oscillatoria sp. FACHB-1407]